VNGEVATPPAAGRHANFWLFAALICVATAPLAGVLGAGLIVVASVAGSALAGTGAWIKLENAWMLFSMGLVYALPLAPVTAVCVPLIYRRASRDGALGRLNFMVFAAFAGLFAPMLIGGIVSLAAWNLGPLTIGGIYGLLGLILAPLCAWLIWPVLRRVDEAVLARA
jgi:MFS family permease